MLLDAVRQGCSRAVRIEKSHLQVCLKLLGILYRSDNDCMAEDAMSEDARGDELYLAMVMLNSSLLKALHVVDSFQMHCHQELPKVLISRQLENEAQGDEEWAMLLLDDDDDERE